MRAVRAPLSLVVYAFGSGFVVAIVGVGGVDGAVGGWERCECEDAREGVVMPALACWIRSSIEGNGRGRGLM